MVKNRKAAAARLPGQKLRADSGAAKSVVATPAPGLTHGVSVVFGYLLLAPALLPLVFIPGFLFPYAAPKTIGFRALAIVALAALVWLVLARAPLHFGRLKQRVTWIPALLLVVAYVASLAGVNFRHSFWSSFERGDGLLTLSAQMVFFYGILLHAQAQFLRRLAAITTWVSSLVALYGLVQWANVALDMPIPRIMRATDRIGATFGNAAFMASYLAMSLFLTLWCAREWRGLARVLAYAAAGLQLLGILVSGTRGTILALLLAGFLGTAYQAWRGKQPLRQRARVLLAAGVVAFGLFLVFRQQLAKAPIEVVRRMADISPSTGTPAVRLVLWKSIGAEALRHPVAGVGAEHIDYVYNKVYTPGMISGQWNDHSHNVYLDYFVQFGTGGLLLYLALVVVALNQARALARTGDRAAGYLFLLFVTYATQDFFVFDIAATLWMFLAVLASTLLDPQSSPHGLSAPRLHKAVPSLLAPAILLLLVPVTVQPVRANLILGRTIVHDLDNPEQEARSVARGLALNTHADFEYGYNVYTAFVRQEQMLAGPRLTVAHRLTQDVLAQNLARYPHDMRTAIYLTYVIDQTPAEVTPDLALLNKASSAILKVSPRRPGAWFPRANAQIRQAEAARDPNQRRSLYLGAIDVLRQYSELQPQLAMPRYAIANIHLAMGDTAQAQVWAKAADAIYRRDVDAARSAANYYIAVEDWAQAVRFLKDVTGPDMTDYEAVFDLARARLLNGDMKEARDLVDYLRKNSPRILDTDPAFIAALQQK